MIKSFAFLTLASSFLFANSSAALHALAEDLTFMERGLGSVALWDDDGEFVSASNQEAQTLKLAFASALSLHTTIGTQEGSPGTLVVGGPQGAGSHFLIDVRRIRKREDSTGAHYLFTVRKNRGFSLCDVAPGQSSALAHSIERAKQEGGFVEADLNASGVVPFQKVVVLDLSAGALEFRPYYERGFGFSDWGAEFEVVQNGFSLLVVSHRQRALINRLFYDGQDSNQRRVLCLKAQSPFHLEAEDVENEGIEATRLSCRLVGSAFSYDDQAQRIGPALDSGVVYTGPYMQRVLWASLGAKWKETSLYRELVVNNNMLLFAPTTASEVAQNMLSLLASYFRDPKSKEIRRMVFPVTLGRRWAALQIEVPQRDGFGMRTITGAFIECSDEEDEYVKSAFGGAVTTLAKVLGSQEAFRVQKCRCYRFDDASGALTVENVLQALGRKVEFCEPMTPEQVLVIRESHARKLRKNWRRLEGEELQN